MLKVMTHIWLLGVVWVSATVGLLVSMWSVDPTNAQILQFVLIYVLIFTWIFSGTAILGYISRVVLIKKGVHYEFYKVSRRQGVWFGLLAFAILSLKAAGIFSLWTGILLGASLLFVEYYALSKF